MNFDTIISRGTAVLPSGVTQVDIGLVDGKIAVIASAGSLNKVNCFKHFDAVDQYVIPGGIDPHIHCSYPYYARENDDDRSASPAIVGKAALQGGTTTLIDFVMPEDGQSLEYSATQRRKLWDGATYCDYGLHMIMKGEPTQSQIEQIPEIIQAGYPSIKIYTTNVMPGGTGRMMKFGHIWDLMKTVSRHGGILAVHAEDDDIVMYMYDKLLSENRIGFKNISEVHNSLSEDLSFNRIIQLASNVEGAALYMMHTTASSGVDAICKARARGLPIYGEVLHSNLMFTDEDYKRPQGQIYHSYPSLKQKKDQIALWDALEEGGSLQSIATDEMCCPLKIRLVTNTIMGLPGGGVGVQARLPLMFTEIVEKKGGSLQHFVNLIATNTAKIMGLYPAKGVLAVGSDADITILDPKRKKTLNSSLLQEGDYTTYNGQEVSVWPSITFLRGKIMYENDVFQGDINDGKFIVRKVEDCIRSRPSV